MVSVNPPATAGGTDLRFKTTESVGGADRLCWLCGAARGRHPRTLLPGALRRRRAFDYNVAFSNFPTAAHVELQVVARAQLYGREAVELSAHVETTGIVSAALYALNNTYVTHVDAATGLPYRTRRSLYEGPYIENSTREFVAAAPAPAAKGNPTAAAT